MLLLGRSSAVVYGFCRMYCHHRRMPPRTPLAIIFPPCLVTPHSTQQVWNMHAFVLRIGC
jgi:hypothetical protein